LQGKPVAREAKQIEKTKAARLANGYRFMADRFYFEINDKGENQFVLLAKQIEPASGGQVNINFPWPLSTA
jgi:hypothetical protein